MDLTPFKNFIKEKCGLSFEGERAAKLAGAINARMLKSGMGSADKYFNCLCGSRDEFNDLVNLLTINETYFFREPAHLQLLVEKLIPEMLSNKKAEDKIRILSAGCSSGEEPYSVVIALMEKYGAGIMRSISVTGSDIDTDAITRAGEGAYYPNSFRDFDCRLKEKYFENAGNKMHKVKDFVRQNVEFRKHNLMGDIYPAALKGVDVIFYRNVAIYFDPETQKSMFRKLADLLNEKGYLFVGSAETLSHNIGILSLIEREGIFLYKKDIEIQVRDRRQTLPASLYPVKGEGAEAGKQKRDIFIPGAAAPPGTGAAGMKIAERRKDTRSLFDEALSFASEKKYDEALKRIDKLMEQDSSFSKCHMLKAGILINLHRIDDAEKICLKSLELDQWCMEGYLLLGLIAKVRNDDEGALKRFKEALYIQSSCWPAHFYLADLYNLRGELESAYREYTLVLNLLKSDSMANHGFTFWPISFPVDEIMRVCNHNISKLRGRLK